MVGPVPEEAAVVLEVLVAMVLGSTAESPENFETGRWKIKKGQRNLLEAV